VGCHANLTVRIRHGCHLGIVAIPAACLCRPQNYHPLGALRRIANLLASNVNPFIVLAHQSSLQPGSTRASRQSSLASVLHS